MEASKQQIASILNGHRILQVPFYQRHYVWQEEQWKRFLDDMELISKKKQDYFLGSVILKQLHTDMGESNDFRVIIDGQQRFTTLAIFAKSLSLKNEYDKDTFLSTFSIKNKVQKTRVPALIHGFNDREDFEKIFYLEEDKKIDTDYSNILKCYNYFQENIDVNKLDIDILLAHIIFIAIDLQERDDEQLIFDTINSLGMRLTTAELLKNYFFSEKDIEQYKKLWKPVFEKDEETIKYWESKITAGRIKRSNIEAFFYAFLNIKIQDETLKVSAEDRINYRKAEGLFTSYKDLISKYNLNKDSFRNDIIEYAKIYRNNFNPEIENIDISAKPSVERINFIISVLDNSTLVPYILFVLKKVEDINERNLIFEYLETYVMRRLLCKKSNNSFSDLFTENLIGNNITTFDGLRDYIENKGDKRTLSMPSDSEVREAVNDLEQPNKRALAILYLMESRTRDRNPHATKIYPFTGYSLEHLMPRKYQTNWPLKKYSDEERQHLIETLGNMTMIPQRLNASISNASWSVKLKGNKKYNGLKKLSSDIELLTDVINKISWNEDDIIERSKKIADKAITLWTAYQSNSESEVVTRGKYSLNGSEGMCMRLFVLELIRAFVAQHKDYTYLQIKEVFNDSLCAYGYKYLGLICKKEEYDKWENIRKAQRYKTGKDETLVSADNVEFYVNTNWIYEAMPKIIKLAKSEGFKVDILE